MKSQLQIQYRITVPASVQQFQAIVKGRKVPNVVRPGLQPSSQGTASGVENWDVEEVCKWLQDLGPAYKQHCKEFHENGIDGEMLLAMTEEDLEDMVKRPIHRKKILVKIEKLKMVTCQ
eukprot:TRINITY_DN14638_c0_g1_i1.p2 TRINITY_DN14638_c0_g1~~TRINITY_DN14638_c0_g1_i1.p2  ORF type:complete len:119 (+),score=24.93 TRINITY_DN14638_c0_g1_i1:427-783(+)